MATLIAALVAATTATAAEAGSSSGGSVTMIAPNNGGSLVFFTSVPAAAPRPACATSDRWSINTTTMQGQTMAAGIYAAMAAGFKINVYGTGSCSEVSDTESVSYYTIVKS
ncbi:MAG: hypothetical protein JF570_03040 [Caulobacter sp.]|nr:hypothetical protein [Caulobacter sp.]MBW8891121.1 hypothetical protein [Burkholderiales bacterium]